jgi:hypothetical protein
MYNIVCDKKARIVPKRIDMTQKRNATAPKMTRVVVRVPKTTLDQINEWVDALGVRRSHFLGIALVAGVRSLMHASELKMPLPMEGSVSAEKPAQRAAEPGASDMDELRQVVQTLKTEMADLQAEIADLRRQAQPQKDGKKRS